MELNKNYFICKIELFNCKIHLMESDPMSQEVNDKLIKLHIDSDTNAQINQNSSSK